MRVLAALAVVALVASAAHAISHITVNDLPGMYTPAEKLSAGYIKTQQTPDSELFYVLAHARQDAGDQTPVVLWMTGGPGCSSELALLFENGPFTVAYDGDESQVHDPSKYKLSPNPNSWNNKAHVIYIDQPYGVGFSPLSVKVATEAEVAEEVVDFLKQFMVTYPNLANNPLFITGESYGGHYVPAVAAALTKEDSLKFAGAAVGNGWITPSIQYDYAPFALQNKLVTESQASKISKSYSACQMAYKTGVPTLVDVACGPIIEEVLHYAGNINIYNVDLPCVVPGLCYNFTLQTDYMNLNAVKTALGADPSIDWATCDKSYINAKDRIASFASDLKVVTDAGFPFIAYVGDLDLICNFYGVYETVAEVYTLPPLPTDFVTNTDGMKDWKLDDKTVGWFVGDGLFTFVRVHKAGHMVPHDQPAVALALLENLFSMHQGEPSVLSSEE